MGGYGWFLFNKREASYHSALHLTISRRQTKLYELKGLDINRWHYLLEECNALRKEIVTIASEYDVEWDEAADEQDEKVTAALKEHRRQKKKKKADETDDDEEQDEVEEEEEDAKGNGKKA